MLKICFFVPQTHVDQVKNAMFEAGAGKIGNYDCCSWQTLGMGQFRPLDGAEPFLGSENDLETVMEYKVEMVCAETVIEAVIREMKAAHPYEEPAFEIYALLNDRD